MAEVTDLALFHYQTSRDCLFESIDRRLFDQAADRHRDFELEAIAQNRTSLQEALRLWGQPLDPRTYEMPYSLWYRRIGGAGLEVARQRATDHFLYIEGVALRLKVDGFDPGRVSGETQRQGQSAGFVVGEALQHHLVEEPLAGEPVEELAKGSRWVDLLAPVRTGYENR